MKNFEDFKERFDKAYSSISAEDLRKEFEAYGVKFKKGLYEYEEGKSYIFKNDLFIEKFSTQANNEYSINDNNLVFAA